MAFGKSSLCHKMPVKSKNNFNVRLMDNLTGQDELSSAWTILTKFLSKVENRRKHLENVITSRKNPIFKEAPQVKFNVHPMDKMSGQGELSPALTNSTKFLSKDDKCHHHSEDVKTSKKI